MRAGHISVCLEENNCLAEHMSVCLEENNCLLSCGMHVCLSRGNQLSVCQRGNTCPSKGKYLSVCLGEKQLSVCLAEHISVCLGGNTSLFLEETIVYLSWQKQLSVLPNTCLFVHGETHVFVLGTCVFVLGKQLSCRKHLFVYGETIVSLSYGTCLFV